VAQQARNVTWELQEAGVCATLVLRDRDAKFPAGFDAVFDAQWVRIARTPFRAPRANGYAERWVRTVREDCLDWLLILGERHLRRVLREYADHYNHSRTHRALGLRAPLPRGQPAGLGSARGAVIRCDRLGGIVHEYLPAAA
jgi:putative transposase